MDQNRAKTLFKKGGFFILLGVPEGTEFGIDLKSWNTGEKFRGVKMIPPGIHYVFYSSVSNTGDTAPRTGFFHYYKETEIVVKKWDKIGEGLSLEKVTEEEVVKLKDNIKALDGFLGPYPFDIKEKWVLLTSNISEKLTKRLVPLCGEVRSALELESCTDANRPRGTKISNDDQHASLSSKGRRSSLNNVEDILLPHLEPKEGTNLRFTVFPEKTYPDGSSPSEITKHSLDSSYLFEQIVCSYEEPTDILGEFEFCYICFLVGHSLEAFEQWKQIFSLFCSCEDAIKKYRRLYDAFLSLIDIQVKEIPEDFLADIVSNKNFVYIKLRDLFRFIKSSDVDGKLKCKADRLRQAFSDLYQWDFSHLESEDEDEAPVIVNL